MDRRNRTTSLATSPLATVVALLCQACILFGVGIVNSRAETQAASGLSALLKRQTQEFSEAGQRGDRAVLDKYLDPEVVFTNETGAIASKAEILDSTHPSPPNPDVQRNIEVTQWNLRQQGNVATATFIDQLTQVFHGQRQVLRFQSTETWARRAGGWKMIASHTMNVAQDPPAIALSPAQLDEYVGVYRIDEGFVVTIKRDDDHLSSSINGGAPTRLDAEVKDVFFTTGVPNVRRIFQRDADGHIVAFVSRRDGTDLTLTKT